MKVLVAFLKALKWFIFGIVTMITGLFAIQGFLAMFSPGYGNTLEKMRDIAWIDMGIEE